MLHEEVQSTNYNLTKRKKIFIFKPKNFDELKKFIKKKKIFLSKLVVVVMAINHILKIQKTYYH
tara:strand:- start:104 stop:295 length:192 start_codon:yes stop_codon:yes gene_type:complete